MSSLYFRHKDDTPTRKHCETASLIHVFPCYLLIRHSSNVPLNRVFPARDRCRFTRSRGFALHYLLPGGRILRAIERSGGVWCVCHFAYSLCDIQIFWPRVWAIGTRHVLGKKCSTATYPNRASLSYHLWGPQVITCPPESTNIYIYIGSRNHKTHKTPPAVKRSTVHVQFWNADESEI